MKLPKKINILGTEYKVRLKKDLCLNGEHVDGVYDSGKQTIFINLHTSKKREIVFFHELLHAIIDKLSIYEVLNEQAEELICGNVSEILVSLLTDMQLID